METRHTLKSSRQLFVQSQQQKHQNIVRILFKVNNKDTRKTSMTCYEIKKANNTTRKRFCDISEVRVSPKVDSKVYFEQIFSYKLTY